jgi:hypothetical protein
MKLNLNAGPSSRLGHLPLGDSHWPHPRLIGAVMHLMTRAGASRIRLLECEWEARPDPLEESLLEANWDLSLFTSAAPRVDFVNTNGLGPDQRFSRFRVPGGGLLFPAYDLHHSYEDCDVFVSIAKFKDHSTTGVTIAMKNLFGMTPLTIYGTGAGKDVARGGRMEIMHAGSAQPGQGALPEVDPKSPRDDRYRLPRAVVDLNAARPVHLAVIDGVRTMAGSQSPGPNVQPVSPGVLLAGTNVVTTDVVATMVMNYDPMAERGQVPFENCDSKFKLAEQVGLGTRDPKRIEIIGPPVQEVMFDFRALREKRRQQPRRPGGTQG